MVELALVLVLCFLGGMVGLAIPFTSGNVSPVWPPAGIALAAMLAVGYRIWPAVAIGAFLVNFFTPIPHVAALGIAVGNTVGPLAGTWLLRRTQFHHSLNRTEQDNRQPEPFAGLADRHQPSDGQDQWSYPAISRSGMISWPS